MKKLFILSVVTFFLTIAAQASMAQVHTPEKGSVERKAILDAVRKFRKAPGDVY